MTNPDRARKPRPATVEEIVACAKKVWDDDFFRGALEKVGMHGDLSEDVARRLEERVHQIGDTDFPEAARGHLILAEPILRSLVDEVYTGFDDPEIARFVEARRVRLLAGGWASKEPPPMNVVIGWFRYFVSDPDIREIGLRNKECEVLNDEDEEYVGKKVSSRMRKHGLQYASSAWSLAFGLFRELVDVEPCRLSDRELSERFKKTLPYRIANRK